VFSAHIAGVTTSLERALIELHRALGPSKMLDSSRFEPYCHDESEVPPSMPDAVVLAASSADVAQCLAICERHGVPVVPRGAGTGKVGGAVPVTGGVVLSLENMRQVKEIARDDLLMVVEPGVLTGHLASAADAEGLYYPVDPNSLDTCSIGGNVATNAGGPHAFKYGVTRDHVLGLQAVLIDGKTIFAGRRTIKGVAGYDVVGCLVGSEGTLGVVTEVTLRVRKKPDEVATLLALFSTTKQAAEATSAIVASGEVPACLELLDTRALDSLRAEGAAIDLRAKALVMIELDDSPIDAHLEKIGEIASKNAIEVHVAQSLSQRDRLWDARKKLSPALRKRAAHKMSEDIVVPRSKLAAMFDSIERISVANAIEMLAYGHAGDGNLHVNFFWNTDDQLPRVQSAIRACFEATLALSGTISGEHGIGVLKAPFLPMEQSRALLDLQRNIKRAFDPKGLLNPGKIFFDGERSHRDC
jgi:glycolate oxidase